MPSGEGGNHSIYSGACIHKLAIVRSRVLSLRQLPSSQLVLCPIGGVGKTGARIGPDLVRMAVTIFSRFALFSDPDTNSGPFGKILTLGPSA